MRFRIAIHKLAFVHFRTTHRSRSKRKPDLQNKLIQAHKPRIRKDQVKVLERLRHPEALALVQLARLLPFWTHNIGNS